MPFWNYLNNVSIPNIPEAIKFNRLTKVLKQTLVHQDFKICQEIPLMTKRWLYYLLTFHCMQRRIENYHK